MATYQHPVTGVLLNEITIKRSSISDGPERETVLMLSKRKHKDHEIAAMFGIHPYEIYKITKGGFQNMPSSGKLVDGHGDPDQPPLI